MKSRSLGFLFIAAVIIPSTLLAVLSIRAAGREEAFVERQLATALDVETTHAASLANAEVARVVEELRAGIDVPAAGSYATVLRQWRDGNALVAVAFLLSPRFGILWPASGAGSGEAEKRFLLENGDFLSDRTATTILQNIADRYRKEILAQAAQGASVAGAPGPAASLPVAAENGGVASAAGVAPGGSASAALPAAADAAPAAPVEAKVTTADTANVQRARDAFAQSLAIQTDVYEAAAEKGDQLSSRVAQPVSKAASNAPNLLQLTTPAAGAAAETAETTERYAATAAPPAEATPAGASGPSDFTLAEEKATATPPSSPEPASLLSAAAAAAGTEQPAKDTNRAPAPAAQAGIRQEQPSQYVVTSQMLSQIATGTSAGLIPRFTNSGLVFLFWERQADGRIAGCEVSGSLFRSRIAGVLEGTATASRTITYLDENGAPLAAPPGDTTRDWSRPFVSREIGAALPRWEAAAYLARPDAISAQARSSKLVIWIMVLILFVSVAGGGTMVLSSVYGEMRLAQKKATFVTNVSHELKTPLTSISLFVELLRQRRPLSAGKRESYLAHMASETERLTRLINNVLDFSAMTAGAAVATGRRLKGKGRAGRRGKRYALESVDVCAVAEQVVESQRLRMEGRGFTITLALPAEPCLVWADPEALKQVLLNLLSNAEKYSLERREIEVCIDASGPEALLHVLDRGIGVAEKDRERIFREFFRVDETLSSRVQGTGLGLTIARRIARDHGGDVLCAPRDGGGSDFIVRLPLTGEREET